MLFLSAAVFGVALVQVYTQSLLQVACGITAHAPVGVRTFESKTQSEKRRQKTIECEASNTGEQTSIYGYVHLAGLAGQ